MNSKPLPKNEGRGELPPRIRAFVAIQLPAAVRERVERFQAELKSAFHSDAVRWSTPGQIHLTLKFLGSIPAESVPGLQAALQRACAGVTAFELCAVGAGGFPDLDRPRVFWIGLGGGLDSLQILQQRVREAAAAWGGGDEDKFRPHLTLGRAKDPRAAGLRGLTARLASPPAPEFGAWRVREIHLMRSELSAAGARHESLAAVPLADAS